MIPVMLKMVILQMIAVPNPHVRNVTNIGVCTLIDFERLKDLLRNRG